MYISETSHQGWCNVWDWIAYKLTIFRVRRRICLFLSTFGACWFGFFVSGYGQNLYTLGYMPRIGQCTDYSFWAVYAYRYNKKRYASQHYTMLNEALFERRGDLDVLEWLTYGKHYAQSGDDNLAF